LTLPVGDLQCHDWLDDEGRAWWLRVVPELHRAKIVCLLDSDALAVTADVFSRWRAASTALASEPMTVPTANGGVKQNPLINTVNSLAGLYLQMAASLGLTAQSRARLGAVEPVVADEKPTGITPKPVIISPTFDPPKRRRRKGSTGATAEPVEVPRGPYAAAPRDNPPIPDPDIPPPPPPVPPERLRWRRSPLWTPAKQPGLV